MKYFVTIADSSDDINHKQVTSLDRVLELLILFSTLYMSETGSRDLVS